MATECRRNSATIGFLLHGQFFDPWGLCQGRFTGVLWIGIMMYHDVSKRQAFIFLACLVRNWLGRNCIPVLASYSQDMQCICSASSRLIQSALKFECHSKVTLVSPSFP